MIEKIEEIVKCKERCVVANTSYDVTFQYPFKLTPLDCLKFAKEDFSGKKYLFSWENVPGNDSEKLLRFLRDDLDIVWAENTEICKSHGDKAIRISKDENSAEIIIDEKKEKATLKIGDGRTHDLTVKKESGKLNIYENIRNLINSLSNIKRSINCQIDQILFVFGFLESPKRERWSFPKKVKFIKDIGITTPEIIEKINRKRNLLEHEYVIPSDEDVSDAIGIAELFIESVKPIFIRYYKDLEVHDDSKGIGFPCIHFNFDYEKHLFKVAYEKEEGSEIEEVEYNHKHQDYLKIVEYYIKFLKEKY